MEVMSDVTVFINDESSRDNIEITETLYDFGVPHKNRVMNIHGFHKGYDSVSVSLVKRDTNQL